MLRDTDKSLDIATNQFEFSMMSEFMNLNNDAVLNMTAGRNATSSVIDREETEALEHIKMCRNARDALLPAIEEALNALDKQSMCMRSVVCLYFSKGQSIEAKLDKFKKRYEEFISKADDVDDVYERPFLKEELKHSNEAQELMDYILDVRNACKKVIEPDIESEGLKDALQRARDILRKESNDYFLQVAQLLTD